MHAFKYSEAPARAHERTAPRQNTRIPAWRRPHAPRPTERTLSKLERSRSPEPLTWFPRVVGQSNRGQAALGSSIIERTFVHGLPE